MTNQSKTNNDILWQFVSVFYSTISRDQVVPRLLRSNISLSKIRIKNGWYCCAYWFMVTIVGPLTQSWAPKVLMSTENQKMFSNSFDTLINGNNLYQYIHFLLWLQPMFRVILGQWESHLLVGIQSTTHTILGWLGGLLYSYIEPILLLLLYSYLYNVFILQLLM